MKFSIIVPIHNAEDYLIECLESIDNQLCKNYEVILVINASTDESLQICKEWAKNHVNTTIIITEIPGVSNARNLGIEVARGDWLVFLDSDDFMRKDALEVLNKNIGNDCDFIIANYSSKKSPSNYSKSRIAILPLNYQKALLDRSMYFRKINSGLTWNPIVLDSVFAKAYNSKIIQRENIKFDIGVSIGEDLLFNMLYSSKVNKICCIDEDIYYYRVILQSASHKSDISAVEKRMIFLEKIINFEVSNELKKAKDFKIVDILLRSIIAGSRNFSNIEGTYNKMRPYICNETVKRAVYECRTNTLSNGKMRNLFYGKMLILMKKEYYLQALKIGFIYNQLMKIKERALRK